MVTTSTGLVSVVITNFNYGDYVCSAIQSALDQTHPSVEVIVVDDASSDDSWKRMRTFEPRARCIRVARRGQIGAAMAGFEQSGGDVVLFLDADDVLLPDAVAMLSRPFAERADVVKAQGYMLTIDRLGKRLGQRLPRRLPASGCYRDAVLRHGLLPLAHAYTSGNAWSRSFLSSVFPLPRRGWLDDYLPDLAPLYGRIESVPRAVVEYRIHGKNAWYGSRVLTQDSMRAYLEKQDWKVDFLADHVEALGLPADRAAWKRWKRSWRDILIEFVVARASGRARPQRLTRFMAAPLRAEWAKLPPAIAASLLLGLIWLLPRSQGLAVAHWALRARGGWADLA
ncbi:glycosyltransferase family 2 protein [Thiorhodococcus minor]|uniref:Glycosyltransferase n=1 Tax=Thiorhodococcus minor TaxID=57489 RepID=A0A6M0JYN7_9GAMM|nr:glycosyltransferase [Thiorhodococcus minor]NEV62204.1 glycosyltransferase [Thiorhodococcus minor]